MTFRLTLLALVGCGRPEKIPEDEYASRTASALCQRMQECDRGNFDATYFSMADCEATQERLLAAVVDQSDQGGCDYDAEQAAYAYGHLLDLSCEDVYQAKYVVDQVKVFDCHATM
jgi:hypothetical protein